MVRSFSDADSADRSMPSGAPESLAPPETLAASADRAASDDHPSDVTTLSALGAQLNATLTWDALVKEIIAACVQLGNASSASLLLPDEHNAMLYIAAAHNLSAQVVAETRVALGAGVTGWVAEQRKPVLLVGPLDTARYPHAFPKPESIGSSICIPLTFSTNGTETATTIGVLDLGRGIHSAPFSDQDLELIQAFGKLAAVALHNARHFRRMQRQTLQLQNLVEINRDLIATLDIDRLLRSVVDRAVELLRCQSGSVLLTDDETQELVFRVAVGPAGRRLIGTRLPPGAGIAGVILKEGKPLIVNDAKTDPRHYAAVDANTTLTTQSLLGVPLMAKETVIGVIEVMNKIDGTPFTDEDKDLLVAFAMQGAIALENARLYSDLKKSFTDTVRIIANAVEARDPYTAGHTNRVTHVALETAKELGWSREQIETLEVGALLHDVGKIGVRDLVLQKPGLLTEDEYAEMKRHPIVGAQMLEGVGALRPMLPYILYHQERYDGKGYPFGLAGKEIPTEGRLLAVVDTFDAMTSDRPYRKGLAIETAIAEIKRNRGTQFDPDVVDALLRVHANGHLILPEEKM
ncbi:MAG: GAF domain-containing protein [Chloroflexi bacterium]|nr:GAF domain-containing protein [Chloroflexota bacterium]